jgi:hypothetical protein
MASALRGPNPPPHRASLSFPPRAQPDHASKPGLGLGLNFVRFSEAARPKARGLMGFLCDGPGLSLF